MNAAFTPVDTLPTPPAARIAILKTLVVGLLSPKTLMVDDDVLAVCRFDAD
jgi:hypothetical protein